MTFADTQTLIAFIGGVSLGALLAVVTLPWLTERTAKGARDIPQPIPTPAQAKQDMLARWRSPNERALIVALRERYQEDERVRG
jgi:hypothetical protein